MKYIFGIYAIFFAGFILYISSVLPKTLFMGLDYRPFYSAGMIIRHGEGKSLYDLPTQLHWQKKTFQFYKGDFLLPFLNPPFVSLPFAFLSLFSLRTSYIIFNLANVLIFVIANWLLFGRARPPNLYHSIIFFVLSLLFEPIIFAFIQGQLSFVLFLSLVASWYCFAHNRPFKAGLWLGLLWIKPQLVILPFLLLVFKRQKRALVGFISLTATLLLLSFLRVGQGGMISYVSLVQSLSGQTTAYGLALGAQPTILGIAYTLNSHLSTFQLSTIFFVSIILSLILLILIWRGKWQPTKKQFDYQWSMLIILMLLTSIHTHEFDLVLLFVPIVVVMQSVRRDWQFYFTAFLIFVAGCFPTVRIFLFPACMVILFGFLYRRYRSSFES